MCPLFVPPHTMCLTPDLSQMQIVKIGKISTATKRNIQKIEKLKTKHCFCMDVTKCFDFAYKTDKHVSTLVLLNS